MAPPLFVAYLVPDRAKSGFSLALRWCLRCEVGWQSQETLCWMCGKDDEAYRWSYIGERQTYGLKHLV